MVSLRVDSAWLAAMDEEYLRRAFGEGTYERGLAYALEGRVGDIDTGDHGRMLTASVRGGRSTPYQCLVIAADRRSGGRMPARPATRCTCPMNLGCKHVVALIVRVRQLVLAAADDVEVRGPEPWERVLREVTAHRPGTDREDEGAPLALQVGLPRATRGGGLGARLQLRPLMRGSSGRWIKTGVSWQTLDYPSPRHPIVPGHRDYLLRLRGLQQRSPYGYYSVSSEHLSPSDLGPHVWGVLAEAADAGVELVGGTGVNRPIVVAPGLPVEVEVRGHDDGDLVVEAQVDEGTRRIRLADLELAGTPAHGGWYDDGEAVVLVGFSRPLDPPTAALVRSGRPVVVPAAQVPRFMSEYYPALHRLVGLRAGDDVEVPEVEPPRLGLDVTFEPGDQVLLRWHYVYGGADGTRLPVVAGRDDPPTPLRDPDEERRLVADLPEVDLSQPLTHLLGTRSVLVPVQRFRGRDTITIATELLPRLERSDDVVVRVLSPAPDYREATQAPRIELNVGQPQGAAGATDWFDLEIDVRIGDEQVPFRPLFTALARGEDHLVLDSGTWFSLDHDELDALRRLIEEARLLSDDGPDGTLRLSPVQAGVWEELVALGVVASQSEAWARSAGALAGLEPRPAADPPPGLRADLRPYQLDGFRWLSFLWDARLGGILADDMGLGKTMQTLALAERARERGELDDAPLLVVAPTSVVGTWVSEAATFAPELRVVPVTETSRRRDGPLASSVDGAHVVVTSYTLLRLDADEYAAHRWSALVLDEAQFVKNRQSKVYAAVRRVPAPVRFAITGTPLENSLMDLWSMLSVTAPGLFPDPAHFTETYRRPIESGDAELLARLRRRIRPLMLRRTKEGVAADLPPKQEQIVRVELTPAHRRVYDTRLARERQRVLQLVDDLDRHRMTILRSLTVLRRLSLAPALVDEAHASVRSTKIDVLLELVADVVAGGHRALVFSQFTGFLGLVRERLDADGIGYQYLDGRTRNRAARIEAFRTGDDPLFLISLKAGGFGLTLTEADYVFVLDPWWNPAAEEQAIDRAHRIGQDKHVNVYRLVAADTIEDKVVALQERKRDLFARVVGGEGELAAPLTADDIRGLLEA